MAGSTTLDFFARLPRELRDAIYTKCIIACKTAVRHKSMSWRLEPYNPGENTAMPSATATMKTDTSNSVDNRSAANASYSIVRIPTLGATCKSLYFEVLQACASARHELHEISILVSASAETVGLRAQPAVLQGTYTWKRVEPSPNLKITGSARQLSVCIIIEPWTQDSVPQYPAFIFQGYAQWSTAQWPGSGLRETLRSFPNVTRLAIEVSGGDNPVKVSDTAQYFAYRLVQDELQCVDRVPQLESFSILVLPSMIGVWKFKENGKWKYKNHQGRPERTERDRWSYTGRPTRQDGTWAQYLKKMAADNNLEASLESKKHGNNAKVQTPKWKIT